MRLRNHQQKCGIECVKNWPLFIQHSTIAYPNPNPGNSRGGRNRQKRVHVSTTCSERTCSDNGDIILNNIHICNFLVIHHPPPS